MDYMQVNSDILSACQNGNYSELKKLIACRNVISNGGNEKVEYCDNYRRPLLAAIQSTFIGAYCELWKYKEFQQNYFIQCDN